jgi:hypothetical protein
MQASQWCRLSALNTAGQSCMQVSYGMLYGPLRAVGPTDVIHCQSLYVVPVLVHDTRSQGSARSRQSVPTRPTECQERRTGP